MQLCVQELLAAASQAAGDLTDFGEPNMREALAVVVNAFNTEARLTPAGMAGKRADIVRLLANRLRMQDAFNRFPQIAEEQIEGPIVIVGLPRSGTTKLQRMLARDPGVQTLPMWRLYNPSPLTDDWSADPDPRISQCQAWVEAQRAASPAAFAAHPMNALEADEEVFVMELTFLGYKNTFGFNTPSYSAWLNDQTFEAWYLWHRRLLQFTQFQSGQRGKPWVVKAPHHLGFLPLLFKTYPGATVVHCHRDPTTTIPSLAALAYVTRQMSSEHADPAVTGTHMLDVWSRLMGRYVKQRPAFETTRPFVDLPYMEVVTDGLGAVAKVYEAAGLPLTPAASEAMRTWDADPSAHDHGKFEYGGPEDYGLDAAVIGEAFETYNRRFGRYQRT